jgi:uncharacterized flavoprotein (TIGR03862 family)
VKRLAVIGGGPAGLMAAEVACKAGVGVDVYEGKGSVGRKFLVAGKGGLNLTHSEAYASFVTRYGSQQSDVARWLSEFNADDVRAWARSLKVDTFIGTSGRVFPSDLKAAPLLRSWVRRLREQGVCFHVHHYCVGLDADRTLHFRIPGGELLVRAEAIVLAMGGGSWPELGSDGRWVEWLSRRSAIVPLQPANCGFDIDWSDVFARRYAGHPVKSVKVSTCDADGSVRQLQGEFVVTATGVEGSAIYALSSVLRDTIARERSAEIQLDLAPDISPERLQAKLAQSRKGRSLTEHLRRSIGIEGVKMGLLYECLSKEVLADSSKLAAAIKTLSIRLVRPRPITEAISSAGGVRFAALDDDLMIKSLPGVFCAGEMIDWEAPTGGYLLTACFASGRVAGKGAANRLKISNSPR